MLVNVQAIFNLQCNNKLYAFQEDEHMLTDTDEDLSEVEPLEDFMSSEDDYKPSGESVSSEESDTSEFSYACIVIY